MADFENRTMPSVATLLRRRKENDEMLEYLTRGMANRTGEIFMSLFGDAYIVLSSKKQENFIKSLHETDALVQEFFGDVYPAYGYASNGLSRRSFMKRLRELYDASVDMNIDADYSKSDGTGLDANVNAVSEDNLSFDD